MIRFYRFNKKCFIPLFVLSLLLCISIGYAYLNSTLNIFGSAFIGSSSFDVHFENISSENGVDSDNTPVINNAKDQVNFEVSLNNPRDFYKFNVDVVNSGTIDAMVDLVI